MVEHVTFNHGVEGSIPSALTKQHCKYVHRPIAQRDNRVRNPDRGRPQGDTIKPQHQCDGPLADDRFLSKMGGFQGLLQANHGQQISSTRLHKTLVGDFLRAIV